ncbi:unnamed protein product [Cylicocyclus nassatus]|uniref:ShKT domain-containing protein n=1 Tax=Cylicocyclus nassatus TaxID=53992 RepID=A0AA36GCT3_CYLNA|nr:unnamed protein product [Cylicocyclus nassatus]
MFASKAFLLLFCTKYAETAQRLTCKNELAKGCLDGNKCPFLTQTCITTALGSVCCENDQIVHAARTARQTPCVDQVYPGTGVSDCPARAQLCTNPTYQTLMAQMCPQTCGLCPDECADEVNPGTGVSDCPARKALCSNPTYEALMKKLCPKTCGYCPTNVPFGNPDPTTPPPDPPTVAPQTPPSTLPPNPPTVAPFIYPPFPFIFIPTPIPISGLNPLPIVPVAPMYPLMYSPARKQVNKTL